MSQVSIRELVISYVDALKEKNAAVFAGAGLSVPAGYVNWKELLRSVAEELGLDIDKETDLIALAQYHVNERLGSRGRINQLLIEQFTKKASITENHKILARLPINTFWTTNYDKLIEKALEEVAKTPDVKIISENIVFTMPKRDAVVYKMHGDINMPNAAVLTKEDYETYDLNRSPFSIVLQGDLFSKTFLFIGFSFEDPNLSYVLTRIKNLIGTNNSRQHYCFFKRETEINNVKKQEFKIKDLHRYGINGILIDDFNEITLALREIENLYKRSQVFISGAAEKFEAHKEDSSKEFVHNLSKAIVSKKYKIISGFGFNIGSGVINGALDYMFSTKQRKLDDYIKLMPFPQFISGDLKGLTEHELKAKKKERNTYYRDCMLEEAGIAIFIFGNKKVTVAGKEEIKNSNGMIDEFEIAVAKGIKPIPIGATGYTAAELSKKVLDNFEYYYGTKYSYLKPYIERLNDHSLTNSELIKITLELISELNKYKN